MFQLDNKCALVRNASISDRGNEHFQAKMSTDKITFLMNWHATPYHAPVYLAQKMGFFADEGLKVALLEPNDPSDVTEIIGSGKVDMGFKAMIHTLAAKARGFPVTSIGSLLDEPFTGVIYLKDSGITTDFRSLKGKKIGYVGEFGKVYPNVVPSLGKAHSYSVQIQIDELTKHYGMEATDYEAVRCGMNVSKAIIEGSIDAGIGLDNVQMVELEEWLASSGRPRSDVQMLRIDELAELGCCCFCSILYIGQCLISKYIQGQVTNLAYLTVNDNFMAENPEKLRKFMLAVKRATDYVLASPTEAYRTYIDIKPEMASAVNTKIFERSYAYFSKDLKNVQRDWEKVTRYGKRLEVLDEDFKPNYTNEFLGWTLEGDSADPTGDQKRMVALQKDIAEKGGFQRLDMKITA
ncbi:thiamine biosynthesis protein [Rutstroemia sp. NJR-2017a BVV2]|nr:thiamine biosynthesis protein [Rutstroemia sp. NJR-2017a BVV2]